MNPSCVSCGRDVPDFLRVCEHCGEPVVEQRLLPVFAESLQGDEQPVFDFVDDSFDPMASFDDPYDALPPVEVDAVASERDVPKPEVAELQFPEPNVPELDLPELDVPELKVPEAQVEAEPEPEPVPVTAAAVTAGPEATPSRGVLFRTDEPEPPRRSRRREFAFATVVIGIGGALTFAAMRANGDTELNRSPLTANTSTAAETPAAAPAPAPVREPAPTPAAAATPPATGRWNANNPTWSGISRRAAAFEVEANNMVSIWMRSVRPTLVVRCTAGAIEAFVYTSSAARIEPGTDDHTVRYSFDSGHETEQRWRDSEEHDALFAPDGESIARRLMDASMFRFVFTPHNAAPASAHFSVAGLRPLIEAARNCRAK